MMIRRSLVVAAVLGVLFAGGVQAQTIGFKLGPSFSTLSGDGGDVLTGTLTKFTGGGFVRFGLGTVALQPELMYVTKGAKESLSDGQSGEVELRLDYVELPVLLYFQVPTATGFAPFLYGGPAFALEVGCKIAGSSGGMNATFDCDDGQEGWTERRKFDVGAMLGGGVGIPVGPGSITLEGRYNFGLLNLDTTDTDNASVRNRSGAVLVGYSIPIGIR